MSKLDRIKTSPWHLEDIQGNEQEYFNKILLKWAKNLPPSENGIIDLAAGIGYEASFLSRNGFKVIAQDPSDIFRHHALFPVIKGRAEKLNYPSESFSGAILKDVLVFLTEEKRKKVLDQVYRILVGKGSLLIASQQESGHRAIMLEGNTPYTFTTSDTHGDEKLWEERVLEDYQKGTRILGFEYKTTPTTVINLARGKFGCEIIKEYSFNDSYARENRWINRHGFIMKLTVKK